VPVRVVASLAVEAASEGFNELIEQENAGDLTRTAEVIYEELIEDSPLEKHEGMGKTIVHVFDACRLR